MPQQKHKVYEAQPTEPAPTPRLVFSLGARDHYLLPQSLAHAGQPFTLLTDYWHRPRSLTAKFASPAMRSRWAPIETAYKISNEPNEAETNGAPLGKVISFNAARCMAALLGTLKTEAQLHRWFENRCTRWVQKNVRVLAENPGTVYAYAYAAEKPFALLKKYGWEAVLLLQNPGPGEAAHLGQAEDTPALQQYARELQLACAAMCNSPHAANLLKGHKATQACAHKLTTLPLALPPHWAGQNIENNEVAPFSSPAHTTNRAQGKQSDVLNIVYLGQINARKGADVLLQAAKLLQAEQVPAHITFIGNINKADANIAALFKPEALPENVTALPAVPRAGVAHTLQGMGNFTVLAHPTRSDGFGWAQLEALHCGLPVMASAHCAPLVTHGHTGYVLKNNTPEALAATLAAMAFNLPALAQLQKNVRAQFSPAKRAQAFQAFAAALLQLP